MRKMGCIGQPGHDLVIYTYHLVSLVKNDWRIYTNGRFLGISHRIKPSEEAYPVLSLKLR